MSEKIYRGNENHHLVRHTAAIHVDAGSEHAKETEFGEDTQRTSLLFNGLGNIGIDFISARRLYIPRIVAGIKSERAFRRENHQFIEELGHNTSSHLKIGFVDHENASTMLEEFANIPTSKENEKIGLELGHIELSGAEISPNRARGRLSRLAIEIANHTNLKATDAHNLPVSHRSGLFQAKIRQDAQDIEIKAARARTNFPVLDIGKSGIQLFVRVAVGYEHSDRHIDLDRPPLELHEVRELHSQFMETHFSEHNIVDMGKDVFAYPVAAALVALRRNKQ